MCGTPPATGRFAGCAPCPETVADVIDAAAASAAAAAQAASRRIQNLCGADSTRIAEAGLPRNALGAEPSVDADAAEDQVPDVLQHVGLRDAVEGAVGDAHAGDRRPRVALQQERVAALPARHVAHV